jgi:hypothetical protein
VPAPSSASEIERQILSLHRQTLICRFLRQEGILAENSHLLVDLADSLMRTYISRRPSE